MLSLCLLFAPTVLSSIEHNVSLPAMLIVCSVPLELTAKHTFNEDKKSCLKRARSRWIHSRIRLDLQRRTTTKCISNYSKKERKKETAKISFKLLLQSQYYFNTKGKNTQNKQTTQRKGRREEGRQRGKARHRVRQVGGGAGTNTW